MKKALVGAACVAAASFTGAGYASGQGGTPPPPAEAPSGPAPEAAPPPTHTVASGEYLWKISEARLGSGNRWVELFAFNRDVLPNPNVVEVGQVLKIPTAPVPVTPDLLASAGATTAQSGTSSRSQPAGSARWTRTSTRGSGSAGVTRSSGGGSRSSSGAGGGGAGGDLASIRACESGGNYSATNGRYRGAYQFDQQTWESVGGSGDPAAASPGEQDARASQLRSQRGSNPWPNCG